MSALALHSACEIPPHWPPGQKMRCQHSLQPHTFSSQHKKHLLQLNMFIVFMTPLLLSETFFFLHEKLLIKARHAWTFSFFCLLRSLLVLTKHHISRQYLRHSLCTMPELINTVISSTGWTTAWEYECVFMWVCFRKGSIRCFLT